MFIDHNQLDGDVVISDEFWAYCIVLGEATTETGPFAETYPLSALQRQEVGGMCVPVTTRVV
jgi:hypothetical protein